MRLLCLYCPPWLNWLADFVIPLRQYDSDLTNLKNISLTKASPRNNIPQPPLQRERKKKKREESKKNILLQNNNK